MNEMTEFLRDGMNRRAFLARMSAAGLGVGAMALLAGCSGDDNNNNGNINDANFPGVPGRSINEVVLNFALTLEIAEADLYRQALNLAAGRPITALLDGQQNTIYDPITVTSAIPGPQSTGAYRANISTGGLSAGSAAAAFLYLVQFAYVEATHRDYLKGVLGAMGAPTVTNNAKGYAYPTGTDLSSIKAILTTLQGIEETGVRAYLGAVPFINDNGIAQAAAAIYSTEARHSASVAYLIGLDAGPRKNRTAVGDKQVTTTYPHENTFEYFADPNVVLSTVASAFFVK